jgi:hypothetical protein
MIRDLPVISSRLAAPGGRLVKPARLIAHAHVACLIAFMVLAPGALGQEEAEIERRPSRTQNFGSLGRACD